MIIRMIILLQVSRRTVSWFHLIKSQDTQDDMTEKNDKSSRKQKSTIQ